MMKIKGRSVTSRMNRARLLFARLYAGKLKLDPTRGHITVFHDYESFYAGQDKREASYYGVNRFLDIEKKYRVRATYNIVGGLIDAVPEVIRRIVADGHDIGGHSYSHRILADFDREQIEEDIRLTKEIFRKYGLELKGIRSPRSRWSYTQMRVMRDNGLSWSAENDSAFCPYYIYHDRNSSLLRIPVTVDDWGYISMGMSPEQMKDRLMEVVEDIRRNKHYGSVGFHPWINGRDDDRLTVFEEFLSYISGRDDLRIVTFGDLAGEGQNV